MGNLSLLREQKSIPQDQCHKVSSWRNAGVSLSLGNGRGVKLYTNATTASSHNKRVKQCCYRAIVPVSLIKISWKHNRGRCNFKTVLYTIIRENIQRSSMEDAMITKTMFNKSVLKY